MDLKFHHLGLAVLECSNSVKYLKLLGYELSETIYDPEQKVNLIMCCHKTEPNIEIIFPADDKGPLENLFKYSDTNIYHICYETKNLEEAVAELKSNFKRIIKISEPKPAVLFNMKKVGFYMIPGFGIIELLEVE